MNITAAVCRALIGLFVDDGLVALQIVIVVVLAGILKSLFPNIPLVAGSVLLIGCLGVILLSVARVRQR